jgi:threonine aldolase
MRQAGVIAAAGSSLETMVERLAQDHARARRLAERLRSLPGVAIETDPPPTNMVYIRLSDQVPLDPAGLATALGRRGILILTGSTRRLRLVLHNDVDDEGVERAAVAFREVLAP